MEDVIQGFVDLHQFISWHDGAPGLFDLNFYQTNWRERAPKNHFTRNLPKFLYSHHALPCSHPLQLIKIRLNIFFTFFLISAIIFQSYGYTFFILLVNLKIFIIESMPYLNKRCNKSVLITYTLPFLPSYNNILDFSFRIWYFPF